MTYKELCEGIAAWINECDPDGNVTAEQIWHLSPSGEIWPIHALHDACVEHGMPRLLPELPAS